MPGNLFTALPPLDAQAEEQLSTLLERPGVRIERIVSTGQASPSGFWYDQDEGEWVVLLSGSAGLQLAHENQPRVLRAGDHLDIPAHCRHRVAWTEPGVATVWLEVFYRA
ncbi:MULTISPECIES: cupin [unclassified Pseudomonas]|uniref:cupin n=1 Tax=unclassified Pseudomonas TaxID=196821 RepID=UPI002096BE19|nr:MULTISPECIES: cupin [unclassified Pseudomonas]MCO7519751.1 cupin [Pseudomonas sp. 1]MCO7540181.1 cupin [Pseudomonas sp. VA159-2]